MRFYIFELTVMTRVNLSLLKQNTVYFCQILSINKPPNLFLVALKQSNAIGGNNCKQKEHKTKLASYKVYFSIYAEWTNNNSICGHNRYLHFLWRKKVKRGNNAVPARSPLCLSVKSDPIVLFIETAVCRLCCGNSLESNLCKVFTSDKNLFDVPILHPNVPAHGHILKAPGILVIERFTWYFVTKVEASVHRFAIGK